MHRSAIVCFAVVLCASSIRAGSDDNVPGSAQPRFLARVKIDIDLTKFRRVGFSIDEHAGKLQQEIYARILRKPRFKLSDVMNLEFKNHDGKSVLLKDFATVEVFFTAAIERGKETKHK